MTKRRRIHWSTAVIITLALMTATSWTVTGLKYGGVIGSPTSPPQPTPSPTPGQTVISGDWDGQLIACLVWQERAGGIGSDCWEAPAEGER